MINCSILRILIMIALCNFLLFYKYLLQIFPSIITGHLMQEFHLSGAGLGDLSACFFYGYAITQLFAGILVDKFGLKIMATSAMLIASCAVGVFVFSNYIWLAMFARLLMGSGGAFATICYLCCTEGWCKPNYRPLADGSLTIGVMLGAFCAEAPLALCIEKYGLQFSLKLMFIAGLFLSLIIFLLLKDGDYIKARPNKLNYQLFIAMLYKKENWLLTAYSGLAFAPLAVFGGLWGTSFIQVAYNYSKPMASGIVSLAYIGFGIGGPLFGYLANRYRYKIKLMSAGLVLSLIALILIVYLPMSHRYFLSLCMIILGLGTGVFMLGFSLGKSINSIVLAGSIVALINSGDAILGAVTEPLIGQFLDWGHHASKASATLFSLSNYQHAFSLLIVYLGLAGFFLFRLNSQLQKTE